MQRQWREREEAHRGRRCSSLLKCALPPILTAADNCFISQVREGSAVGRAIFISYRRDDSEGEAGRLYDDLVRTFGDDSVFMDVAGINPGSDFRKAIDDNVAGCGVLLAMIGPNWATIANSSGQRRLEDENDFVRLEISSALKRNVAVIPVLVHEAKMPRPEELPDNLKDLAYRNSVEITHTRWNSDVQLLTNALRQYVASSSYTNTEPVHATVPVQLPPPHAKAAQPASGKSSKMPLILGIGVVAVLAIAAVVFFAMKGSGSSGTPATASATTAAQPASQPAAAASSDSSAANPIVGAWINTSPKVRANMPRRLEISGTGDQLSFHMWGACPTCDWGSQPATSENGSWAAEWTFPQPLGGDPPGRVTDVTATPAGNELHIVVKSRFPDNRHIEGRWVLERSASTQ
jgi:hypothetical protein